MSLTKPSLTNRNRDVAKASSVMSSRVEALSASAYPLGSFSPSPPSVLSLNSSRFDMFTQCTLEIVSTEEGTFNFWALEVTYLRESSLLLYFCRINWAQDRLSLNYKDSCSTSPVSQWLSLSSGL